MAQAQAHMARFPQAKAYGWEPGPVFSWGRPHSKPLRGGEAQKRARLPLVHVCRMSQSTAESYRLHQPPLLHSTLAGAPPPNEPSLLSKPLRLQGEGSHRAHPLPGRRGRARAGPP